jgi:hypothetical protein
MLQELTDDILIVTKVCQREAMLFTITGTGYGAIRAMSQSESRLDAPLS